jgi:hypothetical protein
MVAANGRIDPREMQVLDALPPMATSNSPTCGHPNSSRQDGQIIGVSGV